MKYLIASDIHGCASAAEKIAALYDALAPDFLVLLGDLLYHGPRNSLPGEYDTKRTAALLNERKEHIIAARGNCDAEVDQLMLEFPCMHDYAALADGERMFFLTHGHLFNETRLPFSLKQGSVFLSGHTHIWRLEEEGGLIFCNPGSVSLPKGPLPVPSYALYDNGLLGVYRLDGGGPLKERRLS